MKALILAAGYGTRLKPYTDTTPKPLFPIDGRPILDIHIEALQRAGCRAVMVNTHHLHHKIAAHIAQQHYPTRVDISYESTILGTGGAIKNVSHFWDQQPFVVINSDIVTDIDLKRVYEFHCSHPHPVTLVLHDDPQFNSVCVDADGFVAEFGTTPDPCGPAETVLTFTGIQILDPSVLDDIPGNGFFSSIDAYRKIIRRGAGIRAFINRGGRWLDIGTPANYRRAVLSHMIPAAFRRGFGTEPVEPVDEKLLQGDGSDRCWYRLTSGGLQLIMADHGIRCGTTVTEADAMVAIGGHLHRCGVPVPRIYHADPFSGLVFMQDLGDEHLQQFVLNAPAGAVIDIYQKAIGILLHMSVEGKHRFDTAWTYQSAHYDKNLILDKECRYFTEAFVQGYLGMEIDYAELVPEFEHLADQILKNACTGFMHRDFQSRNIMLHEGRCHVIDFQGGRMGPLQYDLASLLIDPYVGLDVDIQNQLLEFAISALQARDPFDVERFKAGYRYCCLSRNLQILGAFAFLSRVKGKTGFSVYIAPAVNSLMRWFDSQRDNAMGHLQGLVRQIGRRLA